MLDKYGITQAQADKYATQAKSYFLITFNKLYQFIFSNAQGRAYLAPLSVQYCGLCKRGKYAIVTAQELNAAAGCELVFND